jgi:hypothetical protein
MSFIFFDKAKKKYLLEPCLKNYQWVQLGVYVWVLQAKNKYCFYVKLYGIWQMAFLPNVICQYFMLVSNFLPTTYRLEITQIKFHTNMTSFDMTLEKI